MYVYGKKHNKNPYSDQKFILAISRAASIKNTDPVVSPITTNKMIKMSVRITSVCENSVQVAQLGIQAPEDSSLRKKSSRHGKRSVVLVSCTVESHCHGWSCSVIIIILCH